jgi:hypothetical protein
MRMDAGRVERRRDFKRRELIQRELENAGLRWGVAAGVAVVFFISALLYLTITHRRAKRYNAWACRGACFGSCILWL